jgi:hypothetical protein
MGEAEKSSQRTMIPIDCTAKKEIIWSAAGSEAPRRFYDVGQHSKAVSPLRSATALQDSRLAEQGGAYGFRGRFNYGLKRLEKALGPTDVDGKHGIMNAHCKKRRVSGFNLVELLVTIGAMALLVALVLPALTAVHKKDGWINCVKNLKEIGTAYRTGAEAEGSKYSIQVVLTNSETMKLVAHGNAYLLWQTMSSKLSTPNVLHCPVDKRRKAATSFSQGFSDANISYFFSLDVAEAYPQMILDGDDNLAVDGVPVKPGILNLGSSKTVAWTDERHKRVGTFGMADGSVQQVRSASLNLAIADSTNGVPTNAVTPRWVIP